MKKLNKMAKRVAQDIPITAQAREIMLNTVFADDLPHHGEIFVPDDTFYTNQRGPQQAENMLAMLCRWLGIKPGYIKLDFEDANQKLQEGHRHTVHLETEVLWNEFLLGRRLASELTRYLIEDRKQLQLTNSDQVALLATGSVIFGLGIVVINGMLPSNRLLDYLKQHVNKSTQNVDFSQSFEANYIYLLRGFLKSQDINPMIYSHCMTPWAAKKLGIKALSKPTYAAREAKHTARATRLKKIGLIWLGVVVTGLCSFIILNRAQPESTQAAQNRLRINLLANQINECKDSLAYQRQYADLSDIQTVRNLNAMGLKCQSLDNQYRAALQSDDPAQ